MPRGKSLRELADRLEERQALDVAHRAADLDQHEIEGVIVRQHKILDGVGDMRDHLHRGAEVVAAPLLGDDLLVDPPRGDVVELVGGATRETLVMAEIEVGFRAVVGHEDLAVLIGRHRAWIDVQIRVELLQPNAVAARLQDSRESRRTEAFAEGGDHATGDEDIPCHGSPPLGTVSRFG